MNVLKQNIVANFVGRGWAALMSLAFVPLYIKFLGIEAYGLIGFYAMLQSGFQIFDFGISQTMNREMARYSALPPDQAGEARDFVRTLEIGYWAIGILIGIAVLLASPFIAERWIKPGSIPVETVHHAIMIMGFMAAIQWPLSFYEGGLMGLQKQVLTNCVKISVSTIGSFGALFVLWKVSPSITVFFTWQIIVSALSLISFTAGLWHILPRLNRTPRFRPDLLRNIWRFAAGMSGISIFAIILTQFDKAILSKILSLEMFGYYVLAGSVCNVVQGILVVPVFNALFPRFTSLAAQGDNTALALLYHQGSQLMAVLVLPVAAVLAFFSFDIMLLWTGSNKIAGATFPIVSVLVIGTALNAIMHLPYVLQISHGWTSIGLKINTFFVITLVPTVYYLATHYGPVGAASVWVILNSVYMIIGVPLTHRRLLRGEMRRWFFEDVIPPAGVALLFAGVARWLIQYPMSTMTSMISLSVVFLCTLGFSVLVASHMRTWVFVQLTKARSIWI